ncbi:MAG: hypothetical protein PHW01_02490 [Patescibacteria group bacterium]|nr:hypothetical protein [Patescibacteria group bacterium]
MQEKINPQPLPGIKVLFRETTDFFREHFSLLISLSLILMGIVLIFSFILGIFGSSLALLVSLAKQKVLFLIMIIIFAILSISLLIAALIFQILAQGTVILAIIQKDHRRETDIKKIWHEIFSQAKSIIWVNILTFLATLGGYLLLFIPGLIFGLWFSFGIFVLLQEKQVGRAALKRSRALVKGYFWPIAFRIFILTLIIGGSSIFCSLIPLFGNALGMAISLFALPFMYIYLYLIYKNLLELKKVNQN